MRYSRQSRHDSAGTPYRRESSTRWTGLGTSSPRSMRESVAREIPVRPSTSRSERLVSLAELAEAESFAFVVTTRRERLRAARIGRRMSRRFAERRSPLATPTGGQPRRDERPAQGAEEPTERPVRGQVASQAQVAHPGRVSALASEAPKRLERRLARPRRRPPDPLSLGEHLLDFGHALVDFARRRREPELDELLAIVPSAQIRARDRLLGASGHRADARLQELVGGGRSHAATERSSRSRSSRRRASRSPSASRAASGRRWGRCSERSRTAELPSPGMPRARCGSRSRAR